MAGPREAREGRPAGGAHAVGGPFARPAVEG
jgi:hypothetical protein